MARTNRGDWESGLATGSVYPRCFPSGLAGVGIKGVMSYGKTDDLSYNVAEDPVAGRDLHATLLHQLGIDHQNFILPSKVWTKN